MYSSSGEDLSDEDLANLHIDSLMSLEIRHFLRRSFNVDISLMEISNAGTAGQLSEVIIKALKAKLGAGAIEAVPVD
jgi:acyl carrier protein